MTDSSSSLPHPDVASFVIVAAERTGSNLLRGLLDSHPEICVGGELFNERLVQADVLPWPGLESDAAMLELRRADPAAFLDHAFGHAVRRGAKAVGFKLLYGHATHLIGLTQHLAAARTVKIVHLRRRNRLQRFVSERVASAADEWARGRDADASTELPRVTVDFADFVVDATEVEKRERMCEVTFEGHDTIELTYEALAVDPHGEARRVVRFLGVDDQPELAVRSQKTGTRPLRETVENFDELERRAREIVGFLTD